jgi:mannose/fructose/N-acetylgalactosamine-specific phosphotransferase system component IID
MPSNSKAGSKETAPLSGRVKRQVFWGCLTLQASWNAQRMQNLGLLAALAPWLQDQGLTTKRLRGVCRRYFGYFNTNPYLAGFVIGGLLHLESARMVGEPVSDRQVGWLRDTLARACGALGDQLFWLGLRPALMLIACLFAATGLWEPVLLLFACFSAWQLWWRWRSLTTGSILGPDVYEAVGRPAWHRGIAWTRRVALALTGALFGVYFAVIGVSGETVALVYALLLCCLGIALPILVRQKLAGELQLLLGLGCLILLVLILP